MMMMMMMMLMMMMMILIMMMSVGVLTTRHYSKLLKIQQGKHDLPAGEQNTSRSHALPSPQR